MRISKRQNVVSAIYKTGIIMVIMTLTVLSAAPLVSAGEFENTASVNAAGQPLLIPGEVVYTDHMIGSQSSVDFSLDDGILSVQDNSNGRAGYYIWAGLIDWNEFSKAPIISTYAGYFDEKLMFACADAIQQEKIHEIINVWSDESNPAEYMFEVSGNTVTNILYRASSTGYSEDVIFGYTGNGMLSEYTIQYPDASLPEGRLSIYYNENNLITGINVSKPYFTLSGDHSVEYDENNNIVASNYMMNVHNPGYSYYAVISYDSENRPVLFQDCNDSSGEVQRTVSLSYNDSGKISLVTIQSEYENKTYEYFYNEVW